MERLIKDNTIVSFISRVFPDDVTYMYVRECICFRSCCIVHEAAWRGGVYRQHSENTIRQNTASDSQGKDNQAQVMRNWTCPNIFYI